MKTVHIIMFIMVINSIYSQVVPGLSSKNPTKTFHYLNNFIIKLSGGNYIHTEKNTSDFNYYTSFGLDFVEYKYSNNNNGWPIYFAFSSEYMFDFSKNIKKMPVYGSIGYNLFQESRGHKFLSPDAEQTELYLAFSYGYFLPNIRFEKSENPYYFEVKLLWRKFNIMGNKSKYFFKKYKNFNKQPINLCFFYSMDHLRNDVISHRFGVGYIFSY